MVVGWGNELPGREMETNTDPPQFFIDGFRALTGYAPLGWQERLFRDYFLNDLTPATLDLPTGLGKTSVMVIWYLALKAGARLPRRLVYVVDRRAVVDQATTIADEIKEKSGDSTLRVSTLRGQHVDNRAWLEDPAGAMANGIASAGASDIESMYPPT